LPKQDRQGVVKLVDMSPKSTPSSILSIQDPLPDSQN